MLNICEKCGAYAADKIIDENGRRMRCPQCGFETEIVRPPLFVLTGASGAGKSTIGRALYRREKDYVVMEGDVLWCDAFNTPEDDYREFREIWLRMCKNISQNGAPVLLCGSCVPAQYERCVERRYFDEIYYMAAVCSDEALTERLRARPGWRKSGSEAFIEGSLRFNRWFLENAAQSEPRIELLDTTEMGVQEAAERVDAWIHAVLARRRNT